MYFEEAYHWLQQGLRRQRVLLALQQPMTTKQLAFGSALTFDNCNHVVAELAIYALIRCLNPEASRSRVYGLTRLGHSCRNRLGASSGGVHSYHCPDVSWNVYGWLCYNQRRACLLAFDQSVQPATLKRKARFQNPELRMSANNTRDVVKLFLKQGLVAGVHVRGKAHTHYALTALGKQCQLLLRNAGDKHDLCT